MNCHSPLYFNDKNIKNNFTATIGANVRGFKGSVTKLLNYVILHEFPSDKKIITNTFYEMRAIFITPEITFKTIR